MAEPPPPSHWLAALPARAPRPPLDGDTSADVCIVGAGYTGLWTAYGLLREQPSLDVVVVDAEYPGFGASGRNGGWVLGELAGPRVRWIERAGQEGAARMAAAINDTVGEIERVIDREAIDCDFRPGGTLSVARTTTELDRIGDTNGFQIGAEQSVALTAEELRSRVSVAGAIGAQFMPHCARVQPARLVRGLAATTEQLGARIFERTRALTIDGGLVTTDRGRVRAGAVLRATEGYTTHLPGTRRTLLPMNSSMVVTEPIPARHWAQIGWEGAETLSDGAHRYVYLQRTADGRIAIGGRGVPYRFGSQTDREGPVPAATVSELRRRLVTLFPTLVDVRIATAWHGVLGVARDWMPAVGYDPARRLAWAGGYVGDGVAAANLAGRTLRDLLLGRRTELTELPWVGPFGRDWEPEPFRYAGAHAVYGLYRAADAVEARRDRPSRFAAAADALAGR